MQAVAAAHDAHSSSAHKAGARTAVAAISHALQHMHKHVGTPERVQNTQCRRLTHLNIYKLSLCLLAGRSRHNGEQRLQPNHDGIPVSIRGGQVHHKGAYGKLR